VFVVGAVVLVWLGRRQTQRQSRRLGRVLGAATAAIYIGGNVYSVIRPSIDGSPAFRLVELVPLQLTDLATLTAAYALWSQRHWAYALTYYWGLTLSVQALISPALSGPDFPDPSFVEFWAIHLLVVWAALYLTWGRRMRPAWRSYRTAVAVTAVWAVVAFTFNSFAGTDYGFLNGKPAIKSLLDLLGPWPLYLVPEVVLILVVWALMTWPWVRSRDRQTDSLSHGKH
jgi:hypothetical integral membrane protein (TIGR02206 family)